MVTGENSLIKISSENHLLLRADTGIKILPSRIRHEFPAGQ